MSLVQPDPLPTSLGAPVPADLFEVIHERACAAGQVPRVIIDGPSGSGTTTLALTLVATLEAQLLSLDEIYPGWDGLAQASQVLATDLLEPLHRNELGKIQLWDWDTEKPGDWRNFMPQQPLVIEGAGALTRRTARTATLTVWLELADAAERKRRALRRSDGHLYADFWEMWARQEREHIVTQQPQTLADLVLVPATGNTDPVYTLIGGKAAEYVY